MNGKFERKKKSIQKWVSNLPDKLKRGIQFTFIYCYIRPNLPDKLRSIKVSTSVVAQLCNFSSSLFNCIIFYGK